jgi:hypothetical protein
MMATSGAGTAVVMRGNRQCEQGIDQPGNIEDVGNLRGEDQNPKRIDEADHHRTRDEAREPRQAGNAEGDLDNAGEDDGRQDKANPVHLHHRTDHQRNRTGRRGDHGGPAAENGHHKAQHDRGDQRHLGIDARDERERNHLGDQRQRRNDAGERLPNEEVRGTKHRRDRRRVFEF